MRELGEFFQNREFTPTGRLREASRMGRKWRNGKNSPIGS